MNKITITRVFTSDKDQQGVPFKTKDGKPYTKLLLKATEYGDNWLSGFQNARNSSWKEGDTVEVLITTKVGKDGKTYYNFSVPKTEDVLAERVSKLELWQLQITAALTKSGILGAQTKPSPAQAAEPSLEDIVPPSEPEPAF